MLEVRALPPELGAISTRLSVVAGFPVRNTSDGLEVMRSREAGEVLHSVVVHQLCFAFTTARTRKTIGEFGIRGFARMEPRSIPAFAPGQV
jgi:hypothetical protein